MLSECFSPKMSCRDKYSADSAVVIFSVISISSVQIRYLVLLAMTAVLIIFVTEFWKITLMGVFDTLNI